MRLLVELSVELSAETLSNGSELIRLTGCLWPSLRRLPMVSNKQNYESYRELEGRVGRILKNIRLFKLSYMDRPYIASVL